MALFKFTQNILENKPIELYNQGKHTRDFTYIDDIVDGVVRVLDLKAEPNTEWNGNCPDSASSLAPWRIYNLGNNNPVYLIDYVEALIGSSFKITNPQASSSCGCGTSFSI